MLSGEDLLADLKISLSHERFLAEQALRNLRLRIVNRYAKHGPSKYYQRFVTSLVTSLFIDIAEVLRCDHIFVPVSNRERIAAFDKQFDFEVTVLNRLLKLKKASSVLSPNEIVNLHRELFILLDNVLLYIESHWNE